MELVPSFIARRPHVAEHDFTGIVVDANGTELANGQPVYGLLPVGMSVVSIQGNRACGVSVRLPQQPDICA